MTTITRLAPAVLVLGAFVGTATAQSPARTAGDIALLANALDEPARQTLAAAIQSEDATVRSVAARIAAVTVQAPLADAIERTFASERNPAAAAEQLRALLLIAGARASVSIDARLRDLSVTAVDVYAGWLAANQPERLTDLVGTLGERANAAQLDLVFHVGSALRTLDGKPEASQRLLRAVMDASTPMRWRSVLTRLSAESGSAALDAALVEALKASNAGIREATVWHLVSRAASGRPVTSALLTAAATNAPEGPPSWESFGRELLARRQSGTKSPDRAALLTSEAPAHMDDSRAIALMPQLTDSERQVLKSVLGSSFPKPETGKPLPTAAVAPAGTMRTIPPLWPGFLESLFSAANCKVERNPTFAFASAWYRADGRLAKLELDAKALPGGCSQALQALARLTLMDPKHPPAADAGELLVLPIAAEFVECSNKMVEPGEITRISGKISPPTKTKDVRPDYPPMLQQRGITGTVFVEAIISPAGCITSAAVVRSVVPAMDFAALKAVTGWQFTPTLVDGKPVPVIMTVTVTFSLK